MRVGLLITCLADLMRPSIGLAALKLLERAGCDVVVPSTQTCCGQPGYNSGDRPAAQALARKLISEFSDCDYVVVPSGSCSGMIKTHYVELLSELPEARAKAEWLAARTWELTDFLANVVRLDAIDVRFDGTVTYHDSCAGLREMGVKNQPRELLAKVSGLSIREMHDSEQCCGFGGTFAIKYGDISVRLADLKCDEVAKCKADALVLGDLGCMLNIEGRLRRRGDNRTKVLHVAEVLAGMTGEEVE
ncbi:MAG: (Fe-S)-binding protein [Betaproteobacteria bacterium]|nr:MAG: (Fe-S)-binding protein [Betaproteobacteria bacterium]